MVSGLQKPTCNTSVRLADAYEALLLMLQWINRQTPLEFVSASWNLNLHLVPLDSSESYNWAVTSTAQNLRMLSFPCSFCKKRIFWSSSIFRDATEEICVRAWQMSGQRASSVHTSMFCWKMRFPSWFSFPLHAVWLYKPLPNEFALWLQHNARMLYLFLIL